MYKDSHLDVLTKYIYEFFLIPTGRLFDTIVDRFFDTLFISMHSLMIGPTMVLTCGP